MCKHYQNIPSTPVFMIVFGIHCNFLIVLPIRLKTYRSNVLFFLQGKICAPKNQAHNLSRSGKRYIGIRGKLKEDSRFKCPTIANQQAEIAADCPDIELNGQKGFVISVTQ